MAWKSQWMREERECHGKHAKVLSVAGQMKISTPFFLYRGMACQGAQSPRPAGERGSPHRGATGGCCSLGSARSKKDGGKEGEGEGVRLHETDSQTFPLHALFLPLPHFAARQPGSQAAFLPSLSPLPPLPPAHSRKAQTCLSFCTSATSRFTRLSAMERPAMMPVGVFACGACLCVLVRVSERVISASECPLRNQAGNRSGRRRFLRWLRSEGERE